MGILEKKRQVMVEQNPQDKMLLWFFGKLVFEITKITIASNWDHKDQNHKQCISFWGYSKSAFT
jgi:hypothetical protein